MCQRIVQWSFSVFVSVLDGLGIVTDPKKVACPVFNLGITNHSFIQSSSIKGTTEFESTTQFQSLT